MSPDGLQMASTGATLLSVLHRAGQALSPSSLALASLLRSCHSSAAAAQASSQAVLAAALSRPLPVRSVLSCQVPPLGLSLEGPSYLCLACFRSSLELDVSGYLFGEVLAPVLAILLTEPESHPGSHYLYDHFPFLCSR